MYKTLKEQFVTFYVILGELPMEPADDDWGRAHQVHSRAYGLVEARYKDFPGRRETEHDDFEIDVHELCADDTETIELDGKMAWGIGFVSSRNLTLEQLLPLRDLVTKAYEEAAAEQQMPVRFVGAQRHNVLEVYETMDVDFESESPAIENDKD